MWIPQDNLPVEACSTTRKYFYSRSRKYYNQLAVLNKYVKPASTRALEVHDCGGPWAGATLPSPKSGLVCITHEAVS